MRDTWRRSSRSSSAGGNCVEAAPTVPREAFRGRTSSRSSDTGGNCVEAAPGNTVAIRDSKDPDGPRLNVSAKAWAAFIRRIR